MHYKKYDVRSPLFALKDPRWSALVLALFSGAKVILPPPPQPQERPARDAIQRPRD